MTIEEKALKNQYTMKTDKQFKNLNAVHMPKPTQHPVELLTKLKLTPCKFKLQFCLDGKTNSQVTKLVLLTTLSARFCPVSHPTCRNSEIGRAKNFKFCTQADHSYSTPSL